MALTAQTLFLSVFLIITGTYLLGRSHFRTPDPLLPTITTYSDHAPHKKYNVTNAHFRLYPLFAFTTDDITADLLPATIRYRNDPSQSVSREELAFRIEKAIQEIKKNKRKVRKKKPLTYFTILQDKNFSYRKQCGLIVLKFKEYPFVLKLFMENPNTLINPYATGFEPTIFFYMGGGANRHLSGITRIKNLKNITTQLTLLPQWNNRIELPRKWFWLPEKPYTITIIGSNFGNQQEHITTIPSIYAIVADTMEYTQLKTSLSTSEQRRYVMQLCNDLQGKLDPHFDNYGFKDDPLTGFKVVIVDTEHILTMVGVEQYAHFESHASWYAYLVGKCFSDMFLYTKDQLVKMQTIKNSV